MHGINQALLENDVLFTNGSINKNKINLIAGAIAQPFVETVWAVTNGDKDTLNQMTDMMSQMFSEGEEERLWDMLRLLHGVIGQQFPEYAVQLSQHPEARQYFLFSFLLDFGDALQDYIEEDEGRQSIGGNDA